MKKFIKIISLIVAAVVCSACSDTYKGLEKPLAGAQPEETTVSDSGIAARQGMWIYYINGDNFTREENGRFHEFAGALCRMKTDGSEKDIVVNKDVSVFNIYGERIFLCIYEDNSSKICSVNIDGSNFKELKTIDDIYYGGCYCYTNGFFYYTKDFRLYRMDFEGKNEKKITDFKVYNLRADGDNVFFTREENDSIGSLFRLKNGENDFSQITKDAGYVLYIQDDSMFYYLLASGSVYKYNFETSRSEAVIYGSYTDYVFAEKEGIYGISVASKDEDENVGGIFVVPKGGGQKIKVSDNSGSCMAYYNGYIYYINNSKLNYLYRCSVDGSTDELVMEEFIFDYDTLDIVDNYLYLFSDSDYDRVYRVNLDDLKTECIEIEDISLVG